MPRCYIEGCDNEPVRQIGTKFWPQDPITACDQHSHWQFGGGLLIGVNYWSLMHMGMTLSMWFWYTFLPRNEEHGDCLYENYLTVPARFRCREFIRGMAEVVRLSDDTIRPLGARGRVPRSRVFMTKWAGKTGEIVECWPGGA